MRPRVLCWASLAMLAMSSLLRAQEPIVLEIWPEQVPGETGQIPPETTEEPRTDERPPTIRISNVSKPTITIYKAAEASNTGAAVIIAPGGGYNILAFDKEGTEVAQWLNTIGVTGIVLKYRVPRRPTDAPGEPPLGPLQDAQRAMTLVRSRAAEWGIQPDRIGILGFSAGGNLAARVGTGFAERSYEAVDAMDEATSRPDFCVLVYPAYIADDDGTLRAGYPVQAETPPMFFAHANDDRVSPLNSAALYMALKRAGISSELHIYSQGGHGFGLRPSELPCSTWPARCEEWLKASGFLSRDLTP